MQNRKQTGEFMKRSRLYRLNMAEKKMNKKIYSKNTLLAVVVLAVLLSLIFTPVVYKWLNPPMLSPLATSFEIKTIEVKAIEIPCDYDPITYIRCRGEQLNQSNKDIMTMIRIARAESGLRPDAIGKNTNGTYDMGIFQINDVHSKKISRADRLDFVKNINFAWNLKIAQGFNPWSVCRSKVDCY